MYGEYSYNNPKIFCRFVKQFRNTVTSEILRFSFDYRRF